jgi:hypothetical protein
MMFAVPHDGTKSIRAAMAGGLGKADAAFS